MTFRATLQLHGKTATGFVVPEEVVEGLGAGRKPAVRVTVNGHVYRSSIASMRGQFLLGVSAENRAAARLQAGDEADVDVEVDDQPREVDVPADFATALDADPAARAFFDGLSLSQRRWFVLGIQDAKTPATRGRRIVKAVERLASGRGQR